MTTVETNGGKTGWPPGLLQDDSKKLSQWFASRMDARYILQQHLNELKGLYDNTTDRSTRV